jgi:hypothetical protein
VSGIDKGTARQSDENHILDRTVAHMNVEHYRRLLAVETDEGRRQVLLRLLAEEEAKLSNGKTPDKSKP